ncbi:MAG TPA: protein phosphatase 2C domain-containing protein [Ktedonobacteraceae bacterium]|nr:protein phosphatase 2C domain-containing protein [Ktedonobacteraceae bacterium]
MLCPSCHTPNRDNARFCKRCGLSFTAPGGEAGQIEATGQPQPSTPAAPVMAQEQSPQSPADQYEAQANAPVEVEPEAVEDISLAPTQILTPQQMMAYHARRWQQELEQQQRQPGNAVDIADMPTILAPLDQPAPASSSVPAQEASMSATPMEMPGVARGSEANGTQEDAPVAESAASAPAESGDNAPPPPAPPLPTDEMPAGSETANSKEEVMEQTSQPAAEQGEQEQTTSSPEFPLLAVGDTVSGRYEVTQVDSTEENEHVYQVVDHQGYQRCWNCGSEQNAEGDEFCIDCGAELLNATYIMHEYPAAEHKDKEEQVLQGVIVNTFVDQGRTYVIEQPQASQLVFPNGVHLLASCESDAGVVRSGEPNEDSTLVLLLERVHESIATPAGVFVVADGMGGHANGQGASKMTIGLIAERIVRELLMPPLSSEKSGEAPAQMDEDAYVALVRGAIEDANSALCQANQRDKSDMGSTLTGFMMVGDHAYIFNVGDSRTYLVRDSNLHQLTLDHSLVGQMVAGGLIEPDDVYTHPQRSQIYRSIGDKLNVQIDVFKQQVYPGDILLSCSDGLWEMVRNPQIADILTNAPDPQAACARLIEAANANGGEDNISAVVVFVR